VSVADRVTECINKYNANDLDNALIQLCIALDGTAKNEYPRMKKVGERFKAFIKANQDIITFFTFNTNIFINCEFGGYTIEQFIYKVLRCGLLHEGEVSAMFKFAEAGEPLSISGKQWCFPRTFVFGTLLAVIGAPTNARQSVADQLGVTVLGKRFKVNELWGRADLVRETMAPPVAVSQIP
jgi:hypothetical protein